MSIWYCGSVQYAAVPVWATGAKGAGAFCRQVTPATDAVARVFRTAAGGASGAGEPVWNTTKGSTTADNTVTWTEVTGNSTYAWSAPHSRLANATNSGWMASGDTVYVASNHAYSGTTAFTVTLGGAGSTTQESFIICVNAAGSVPPVAADITTGATETTTGNVTTTVNGCGPITGVKWIAGSGQSGTASINLDTLALQGTSFQNCGFTLASTGGGSRITFSTGNTAAPTGMEFIGCTFKFAAAAQAFAANSARVKFVGGSIDAAGTAPTNLFKSVGLSLNIFTMTGVDLSALGSNTIIGATANSDIYTFTNCKFGASYVLYTPATAYEGPWVYSTVGSASGINYDSRAISNYGTLTTETSVTRTGGASDGVTPFSWKIVTPATVPTYTHPFAAITRAVWNDVVGTPVTMTIEIENDGTTLKDSDIWVDIDYLGASSSPLSSRATSKAATILTAGNNLTTSTVTWGGTGGQGAPTKQKITKAFTPQMKGYVYYTINVAKASQTLYVDMATVV